jgi:Domain of unknown function (DUF4214)/Peptidase inhibitor family I36
MNQTRTVATGLAALAFVLGASTMAAAVVITSTQPRWGQPATPESGACFYRQPNFGGQYFCAKSGENIESMSRGMTGQIASIRRFGAADVTIFQSARYAGRWTRLAGDVTNLRGEGWLDRLSSIRVGRSYGRNRAGSGVQDGAEENPSGLGTIETTPWVDRAVSRDGSGARYNRGGETTDATVRRLYQEVLQREPDPQGLAEFRNHMRNDRWSEQDVRDALLQSPEYRQKTEVTPQQSAEQLVARAYRAILGREPDPASRVYVDKVLRENWTEADVSRELRNSPEYRSKHQ